MEGTNKNIKMLVKKKLLEDDIDRLQAQVFLTGGKVPCTEGHEWQCIGATPGTKCNCECGGVNHGKARKQPTKEQQQEFVTNFLKELKGDNNG